MPQFNLVLPGRVSPRVYVNDVQLLYSHKVKGLTLPALRFTHKRFTLRKVQPCVLWNPSLHLKRNFLPKRGSNCWKSNSSISDIELAVIFIYSPMKLEQVNYTQRLWENTYDKNISAELGLLFSTLYFSQPLFAQGHVTTMPGLCTIRSLQLNSVFFFPSASTICFYKVNSDCRQVKCKDTFQVRLLILYHSTGAQRSFIYIFHYFLYPSIHKASIDSENVPPKNTYYFIVTVLLPPVCL